ncbi:S8 family serine peptidase [Lysobacter sp. CCNWLW3]|uniref:S8 family peptidase n=1 Tax=unclassified Lysobacter TaxID=2635362 RepID=UPI002FD3A2B8
MKPHSYLFVALLGAASIHSAMAAPPPGTDTQPRFIPYEVLVKFKPGGEKSALAAASADIALERPSQHFWVAKIRRPNAARSDKDAAKAETLALLAELRQRADVEYAQLNYLFEFSSDPLFADQWHYPLISLSNAWAASGRGNASVRIAVLDSGRSDHPDLSGRFMVDEYNMIDEYNAPAPGQPAKDNGSWRHGTHVAGIVGATVDNNIGGAGVCPGCTLMNVKVGDSDTGIVAPGSGDDNPNTLWITNSIDWATENGARVINMSFEFPGACTQVSFPVLRAAIRRARDNGVTLVAAAGNGSGSVDNATPASCPDVISVAAVDPSSALALYSNRGPNIGITAPGGGGSYLYDSNGNVLPTSTIYGGMLVRMDVPQCNPDLASSFNPDIRQRGVVSAWTTSPASGNSHCYRYLSGTSMAAPHVSGTVGLMLSVKPNLRPDQVGRILQQSATALLSCGTNCGPGLLNVANSVALAATTSTGPCSAGNPSYPLSCSIEGLSQYVNGSGTLVESVYAYGYRWQFDAAGNQSGVAKKLNAFPHYKDGPCQYAPAGQICTLDSVTTLDYPEFGYIESVTAYGRFWNFDQNNSQLSGSGSLLTSVPRYANGPCAYAGGAPCTFDTRDMFNPPQWGGLYESITAYGRYWTYDAAGSLIATNTLLSTPRYANGPCAYRPAGTTCKFGSREQRSGPNGIIETVTAYGRYFEWDGNGNPTANNGVPLNDIPRLH